MAKQSLPVRVVDLFADFAGFRSRAMFGGFGLYLNDIFFAVVADGRLYLKVSDETRPDYEADGMGPFHPDGHSAMRGYYEVPPRVAADPVLFREWVFRAVSCQTSKSRRRK